MATRPVISGKKCYEGAHVQTVSVTEMKSRWKRGTAVPFVNVSSFLSVLIL